MAAGEFVVRVNRLLLLGLAAIGLLFVAAGFFLIPTIAGAVLFWLLGGVVAAQCLWYALFPPVMLRLTADGLAFGTGFRYTPFFIPWQHVVSVDYGVAATMTAWREKFAGVSFTIADTPDVPAGKATSAGVSYMFRRLTIHWLYANRFPWTIARTAREFLANTPHK